jgi:psiF repeat
MLRPAVLPGIILLVLVATPASAITPEQKMETCKFGADHQKLTGAARKTFIAKCMEDEKASTANPKQQ